MTTPLTETEFRARVREMMAPDTDYSLRLDNNGTLVLWTETGRVRIGVVTIGQSNSYYRWLSEELASMRRESEPPFGRNEFAERVRKAFTRPLPTRWRVEGGTVVVDRGWMSIGELSDPQQATVLRWFGETIEAMRAEAVDAMIAEVNAEISESRNEVPDNRQGVNMIDRERFRDIVQVAHRAGIPSRLFVREDMLVVTDSGDQMHRVAQGVPSELRTSSVTAERWLAEDLSELETAT